MLCHEKEPGNFNMKILFLAHRIPYPPNKGDKLRAYNIIRHLAEKHHVCLVSLYDDPSDRAYAEDLKKICEEVHVFYLHPFCARARALWSLFKGEPFTVGYFYNPSMKAKVKEMVSSVGYDRVFAYSSSMAQYCEDLSMPKIMDLVDCDSAKWAQYSKHVRWPMSLLYARERSELQRYEKEIIQKFDDIIVVSEGEKHQFSLFADAAKINVIPNGVDTDFFVPGPPVSGDRIVFTGAMDYYANVDAVTYFCSEIFPLIRRRVPAAEFYIVGHRPSRAVLALAKQRGVTVTGSVGDIREYLGGAEVAVVPLRIAQGVQNKILEAMAMGLAVVTTARAAAGLAARPGRDLFLADTAGLFAEKVVALLEDEALRKDMGAAARELVLEGYLWENTLKKLDGVL
jgi:sugar transferase (PEP-CTERM/EpsH1 system associated)